MKPILKIAGLFIALIVLFLPEIAAAQAGHMHRATRRRTAVVVSSATHASDEQAAAAQQSSDSSSSSTSTDSGSTSSTDASTSAAPTPAPTTTPAPAPAEAGKALALGTVVSALPSGCTTETADNVEYYHCGPDYYRSAFQGNTLVYVTTAAPG